MSWIPTLIVGVLIGLIARDLIERYQHNRFINRVAADFRRVKERGDDPTRNW